VLFHRPILQRFNLWSSSSSSTLIYSPLVYARMGWTVANNQLYPRISIIAASFIIPHDFKSSLIHSSRVCLHLLLHLVLVTNTFQHADTHSSFHLRLRWLNHFKRPRLATSATHTTPIRSFSSLLDIQFSRINPHIHIFINISILSNLCMSSDLFGQVSLPYTITLCTQALYTCLLLSGKLLRRPKLEETPWTLPKHSSLLLLMPSQLQHQLK